MSRSFFLGLVISLLLLAGLATVRGGILALSLPLFVYLMHGLWRAPERVAFRAQRELGAERVAPQTPVGVRLVVTNLGEAIEELALADVLSPGLKVLEGSHHHLISLDQDQSVAFDYVVSGPRGGFPFEAVHFEAGEHLGLVRIAQDVRTFGQLFVFPAI